MKRILINSKSGEETRIATLDNGKLIDLDIESVDREQKKQIFTKVIFQELNQV